MEPTIIMGIVVTLIVIFFIVKLLLKRSNSGVPSLDAELHIHPESQKPVIPRHVRDQLTQEQLSPAPLPESNVTTDSTDIETPEPVVAVPNAEVAPVAAAVTATVEEVKKPATDLSLNTQLEKAQVAEFQDESSILDAHLHQQNCIDEESALANAEDFITLHVYADRRILSGDKTLKLLMKYGLRYGEMSCFHRYNEAGNKLLFSVLQLGDNGPVGFDLETLSTEQVKGLAFFLVLPHSDVQNAFDTMESIARLIAREFDGTVYDANNQEFTPQMREHWRHYAIDFRSGQSNSIH